MIKTVNDKVRVHEVVMNPLVIELYKIYADLIGRTNFKTQVFFMFHLIKKYGDVDVEDAEVTNAEFINLKMIEAPTLDSSKTKFGI